MSDEVYLVDKDGQSYGLKIFTSSEGYGLENAIELEVLTSFFHPSLIRASEILDLQQYGIGILLPLGKMTLKTALSTIGEEEINKGMGDLASCLLFLHSNGIASPSLKSEDIIVRGESGSRRLIIASLDNLKPKTDDNSSEDVYNLGLLYFNLLTNENYQPNIDRLHYLRDKIGKKSPSLLDLLFRMLDPDPLNRITSPDVMKSGFFITNINYFEPESHVQKDENPDIWVSRYWTSKVNGTADTSEQYDDNFLSLEKEIIMNRRYQ